MAIVKNPVDSRIKMTYDFGINEQGKAVTKTKTISNVKPAALDQDIFDVVTALAGLQSNAVIRIIREDNAALAQA